MVLLGEFLAPAGHDVTVCTDAVAALAAAAQLAPDIAILDICRLIALTGYGQESDRSRSASSGFDAHLVKPVLPDELLRLLAGAPATA